MIEWSFVSARSYSDPFHEVQLDVIFDDPQGQEQRAPAFWAGEQTWRVRYSADMPGRYRFRTIRPGIYVFGSVPRPRHIHFDITSRHARLTTQMYFPGEEGNALEDIAEDSLLVARIADPVDVDAGVAALNWDIRLPYG